ncbi:MAG: 4-hydroxy-3-methylbut-2-enyl diphosphate reductase [Phycisphaerales bacterium]
MPQPMKLILANPRGFCAGVYMAIDVVDQLIRACPDETIYVYHEIVHNRHVVDRFRQRGVVFVEDVADVPTDSIVVFSAHGVSPAVRDEAREAGLHVVDATCPLVTKVHAEAIRYSKRGYQILLIGHADHQEVIGTRGEAPQATQVVESPADIPNLVIDDPAKLVYLTQTTLSVNDAAVIIEALKQAFPEIHAPPSEDICYATTNRQSAVKVLAPLADLTLVVGSRNSSNSMRLVEISESVGTPGRLIDDVTEVDPAWFASIDSLLLTAGASAPEDLVRGVIERVIEECGGSVEQHEIHRESVEFAVPISLRRLMDARGTKLDGDRITVDMAGEIDRWLTEQEIEHQTVSLSVSATGGDA